MNELSSLIAAGWVQRADGEWEKPKNRPADTGPVAVVERSPRHEPLAKAPAKSKTQERFRVCVESVRKRLCDPDNLYIKAHLDNCRMAGIIPDDSAKFIDLEVRQRKTVGKESEHTKITIERI